MKTQMNTIRISALIALASMTPGHAHLTYTGRDFGILDPGNETRSVTEAGSISSNFGWAYSTDSDLGDSHRNRAFRFTLASAGEVTVTVQRGSNSLLPAFSIYSGLAHIAATDAGRDHDDSPITQAYLAGVFGGPNIAQGAFNALGDWKIGAGASVPDGITGLFDFDELSTFVYRGNAADGGSENYGSAAGINGDGLADGFVSGTFFLAAGDYTLMVGGANLSTPDLPVYPSYATNVTVSVVPETSMPLLLSLSALVVALRRRRS
jgi:hypothetical protein